jgi:hypothetical protein
VTQGDYALVSLDPSVSGATVQNDGNPIFNICSISGPGKVPLYYYNSAGGQPLFNTFGTSSVAPSGYIIGNNGVPLGYIYNSSTVGNATLKPVNLLSTTFNNGTIHCGILGSQNSIEYGGIVYSFETCLGYSL